MLVSRENLDGANAIRNAVILTVFPEPLRTSFRRRVDLALSRRLGANYFRHFDNILWLTGEKAVQLCLSLFVGAFVARFLGPNQFGLLGYAQSVVSMAAAVATLGLDNIVVRQLVIDPGSRNECLSAAALLRLASALLFIASALIYCSLSSLTDGSPLLILIMMLALPFGSVSVLALDLQALVASKQTALARSSQSLLCAFLRLLSIFLRLPVAAFACIVALEGPLFAAMLALFHRRAAPAITLTLPRLSRLAHLLREGWPLLLSSVSVILYMKMDQIMLKFMRGDHETGIYLAAVRLSDLWNVIPVVICSSVYPSILKARTDDPAKYVARMQSLYDAMFHLSLILALFTTFLATPIVALLFGSAYLDSVSVMRIHIWSTIAVFLGVSSGHWLLAEGLQVISLIRTALGLLTNLILNLILIPAYGACGAALATRRYR